MNGRCLIIMFLFIALWQEANATVMAKYDFVVSKNGDGDFSAVQEAIYAAGENCRQYFKNCY